MAAKPVTAFCWHCRGKKTCPVLQRVCRFCGNRGSCKPCAGKGYTKGT
jgi:hypothetical protein